MYIYICWGAPPTRMSPPGGLIGNCHCYCEVAACQGVYLYLQNICFNIYIYIVNTYIYILMYMPSVEPSSPPEMPQNSSPPKSPTMNHDLTNRVIERIESALCPELKAAGYTDTWFPKNSFVNVFFVGQTFLGGGFKDFVCSPLLGEDFQFDYYFSDGLKPPTRNCWEDSYTLKLLCMGPSHQLSRGCTHNGWRNPSRVTVGNMQICCKGWYWCKVFEDSFLPKSMILL